MSCLNGHWAVEYVTGCGTVARRAFIYEFWELATTNNLLEVADEGRVQLGCGERAT